jgi:hypothetical protein
MSPQNTHSDRQFRRDTRAVSEVIGAILMFALLFLVLVLIQVNAVPAANQQVEFEHNQRVIQDFQSLQDGLFRASATGQEVSVPIETGVSYPSRFFLLNPGPATGALRTTGQQPLTIDNARASGNVRDFWSGNEARSYTTTGVSYQPNYNELAGAGTLSLEHSMLYRSFDSGNRYFDDPTGFVDGNQIRLTLLTGNFSRASLSTSVELAPVSHQQRTISIADNGEPITIAFRTDLDQETLDEQITDVEPNVQSITKSGETATLTLSQGVSYELTMSKIRVGSTSVDQPDPAYITDIEGNNTAVGEGTSRRLTVEVRDKFNNPVSNVDVTSAIQNGPGTLDPTGTVRTDSEGRVTLQYDAPTNVDGGETVEITATMPDGVDSGTTVDTPEQVTFEMTVTDSDGSGSDDASDINPYGPNTIQLEDAVIESEGSGNNRVGWVSVTLKNTYPNTDVDISQARLVMYASRNQQGNGLARTPPEAALLYDDDESAATAYTLERGGAYATTTSTNPLDTIGQNGGTQAFIFEMVETDTGDHYLPVQGEIFTVTIEFDNGERRTYLITPRST